MASVFVVKGKLENPMEWYSSSCKCDTNWMFDTQFKAYHLGSVYMKQSGDTTSFEDLSEQEFFGWETSDWIALAGYRELIYGSYNEDGSAEFVHIKDGVCLKDYRMYEFELDTEEGDTPAFEDWADVCEYIDTCLLSM